MNAFEGVLAELVDEREKWQILRSQGYSWNASGRFLDGISILEMARIGVDGKFRARRDQLSESTVLEVASWPCCLSSDYDLSSRL